MDDPQVYYTELRKRMLQFLRSGQFSDQVFEILQTASINALGRENIVLSRPEKNRLLKEVMITALEELLAELKAGKREDFSL